MLAMALNGNTYAQIWVNNTNPESYFETAIAVLEKKIAGYESWNQRYPGFGGFIPWIYNYDSGIVPTPGFATTVPGLDNGQMCWAIHALVYVLQNIGQLSLAARYDSYLQIMISNAVTIFYAGEGHIRTVATISNVFAPPSENTYGTDCGCNVTVKMKRNLFSS